MSDISHTAYGERDAPDLHLVSDNGLITATMIGADETAYTVIDLDAALKLGEWLIAHAIAGGARPAPLPLPSGWRGTATDLATPYVPAVIYYPEAGAVEYVTEDTASIYEEIGDGAAIIRDMQTRAIIGFRIDNPKAWLASVIAPTTNTEDRGDAG